MEKKALGRGLEALFDRPPNAVMRSGAASGHLLEIETKRIIPGKYQPRKVFKEPELESLAHSLKGRGMLQPVIVRRAPDGQYELIAGERRWRAARRAGLERIPALLREVSDAEAIEVALIENLQRQDLNPIEAAKAYRRLTEEFQLTQEEVARRVGKDRSSVANTVRLLGLPAEVQEAILSEQLSAGHAKALLSLPRQPDQLRLAHRIIRKGLSVRATESAVKRLGSGPKRASPGTDGPIREAEERLMRFLGTKVQISGGGGTGRILIRYLNTADLDRVIGLIVK